MPAKAIYKSCSCKHCRGASKGRNGGRHNMWKHEPHKALRRAEKAALRKGEDPPQFVSGDRRA